jgi:hypothetical protein
MSIPTPALHDNSQQEPTPQQPGTYSTAVETNDEVSGEYMGIPQTQPVDYDLLEDLLKETQVVTQVLEPTPRSLSEPVNAEAEEKKEDPLYTEIPLPATNSV